MQVLPFPFLMPAGRRPGLESPSNQGRGTQWSVAPEGVWQREGRRALERRGRETQGSLEQRKRPTLWVGRLPTGSGPERPIPGTKVEGSRPSGLTPTVPTGAWCTYGKDSESLITVSTRSAKGRDGRVLDARKAL